MSLFEKYDVPAPRYTSYPTVPYWSDSPTTSRWLEDLNSAFEPRDATWSMYIHIPYCETLCTFCGCNTIISKSHSREEDYVNLVLKEWSLYLAKIPKLKNTPIRQLHLGGGTPTFFSPGNLKKLLEPIFQNLVVDNGKFEGSVEVDPRRTTTDHLKTLFDLGFRRVSMGVQDFDPEVQRLVNRIQPHEITKNLTNASREMGYESVNFDLIYGLPKQTLATMKRTVELTIDLRPDRIALYSFALVPWIKPAQRLFKDEDLPKGSEKRNLYELSRKMLVEAGYIEIGMDHFALPTDSLSKAALGGSLHRNFMGYTERRTDVLLGLGVSAISETPTCFHQNEKVLPIYERKLAEATIPTLRGHMLSTADRLRREQILKFITTSEVELSDQTQKSDAELFLAPLIADGLVKFEGSKLKLTSLGRPFLRNACMVFDERLRSKTPDAKVFSQSL